MGDVVGVLLLMGCCSELCSQITTLVKLKAWLRQAKGTFRCKGRASQKRAWTDLVSRPQEHQQGLNQLRPRQGNSLSTKDH
jgi:hypothetical protein